MEIEINTSLQTASPPGPRVMQVAPGVNKSKVNKSDQASGWWQIDDFITFGRFIDWVVQVLNPANIDNHIESECSNG